MIHCTIFKKNDAFDGSRYDIAFVTDLEHHLQDPMTVAKLCYWPRQQCPMHHQFEYLQKLKLDYVHKEIRREITRWDNTEQRFKRIQNSLLNSCCAHFAAIDNERQAIEAQIVAGANAEILPSVNCSDVNNLSSIQKLSVTERVILGVTFPLWLPLGLVVGFVALSGFSIHKLITKHRYAKHMKQYEADPGLEMATITQSNLEQLIKTHKLQEIIMQHFDTLQQKFIELYQEIPSIVAADEDLICKLSQQVELNEQFKSLFAELCPQGDCMRNELDFLYVTQIGNYTMNVSTYVDWQFLGEGKFARVYRATGPNGKYVALKAMIQPLCVKNVTNFLVEEQNLRCVYMMMLGYRVWYDEFYLN